MHGIGGDGTKTTKDTERIQNIQRNLKMGITIFLEHTCGFKGAMMSDSSRFAINLKIQTEYRNFKYSQKTLRANF